MHIFLYFYLWYYMGLMMEILKPSELGKTPEIWGESIKIYKNESKNVEIGLFTVGPNKSMDIHKHDEADELIYVLEGRASFSIDNVEKELTQGSAILIPRKINHKAFNKSSEPYNCLYIICQLK